MRVTKPSVCCVVLLLGGCGSVRATPDASDGSAPDRVDRPAVMEASTTGDTDNDGLCDATELTRRTSVTNADSDGDGLLDSTEVRLGTDPLSGRDPRAADRVLVREGDTTLSTLEHTIEYSGTGEVLGASMQDRGTGLDGLRAIDLADFSVEAVSANPAAFVRAVDGARFVGVLGRVVLSWRLTVRPRAGGSLDAGVGALGCRRAYDAQLVVKREGEEVAQSRRVLLELAPPEGSTQPPAWPRVSPEGLCLPARCF